MNARSIAAQVVEELARRQITVVAEDHNTTDLAAIHHPHLDGPTAFILVLSPRDHAGWHAAARTATDEYAALPSRLDGLRPDAISDVVDAIQTHLENEIPYGSTLIETIEQIRAQQGDRPLLLVLRGEQEAADAIVEQWTDTVRSEFDSVLCVDTNDHRVRNNDRWPPDEHGDVSPIDFLGHLLAQQEGQPRALIPPKFHHLDENRQAELLRRFKRYQETAAHQRVLVHLHNADEPTQARYIYPTGPRSIAIITTRQNMAGLRLDDARFLDV